MEEKIEALRDENNRLRNLLAGALGLIHERLDHDHEWRAVAREWSGRAAMFGGEVELDPGDVPGDVDVDSEE